MPFDFQSGCMSQSWTGTLRTGASTSSPNITLPGVAHELSGSIQWAANRTTSGWINVPVQNICSESRSSIATADGKAHSGASMPLKIFAGSTGGSASVPSPRATAGANRARVINTMVGGRPAKRHRIAAA
jgi:hypothetical protein